MDTKDNDSEALKIAVMGIHQLLSRKGITLKPNGDKLNFITRGKVLFCEGLGSGYLSGGEARARSRY